MNLLVQGSKAFLLLTSLLVLVYSARTWSLTVVGPHSTANFHFVRQVIFLDTIVLRGQNLFRPCLRLTQAGNALVQPADVRLHSLALLVVAGGNRTRFPRPANCTMSHRHRSCQILFMPSLADLWAIRVLHLNTRPTRPPLNRGIAMVANTRCHHSLPCQWAILLRHFHTTRHTLIMEG